MTDTRDKLSQPPAAQALVEAREARRREARTKATLELAIKQLEVGNSTLKAQVDALLGLEELGPVAPIKPLKREAKGKPEATYVMMASDWHVEERVRPEMVRGLNAYSPEIARERADQYFRSNIKILEALRGAWDVKQLVWWLGGDLITGFIHDELVMENYLAPSEAMYLAYEILLSGAHFLLEHSAAERIVIPTSSGNHGRGQPKRITCDFRTSYEFLMYRMLAKALATEKRIEFQLGQGYENHLDVYGYRIAFHHGDEVTYNGGVGGVFPSLYRRIHRVGAGAFARDLDVFGHFHQLGFAPGAFGNGSLIGYNAYAAAKGFRPEPPQQGAFLIDAKHKVPVAMTPVFVTKERK